MFAYCEINLKCIYWYIKTKLQHSLNLQNVNYSKTPSPTLERLYELRSCTEQGLGTEKKKLPFKKQKLAFHFRAFYTSNLSFNMHNYASHYWFASRQFYQSNNEMQQGYKYIYIY